MIIIDQEANNHPKKTNFSCATPNNPTVSWERCNGAAILPFFFEALHILFTGLINIKFTKQVERKTHL